MIGKRTFKLISLKLSLNNYSKFVIYMNNTDTGIDIRQYQKEPIKLRPKPLNVRRGTHKKLIDFEPYLENYLCLLEMQLV